jgi:tRNA threonylcarbamoyladenosine biosynthesis protein TsaB
MLLALDTATSQGSLALFDGRRVLTEITWRSERRHGDELFPLIDRALEMSGAGLRQVDRIGVAIGPGSFTGLRIAIAAAKGLARGLSAALTGISTLDILAHAQRSAGVPVCPLISSGRNEFYAALYEPAGPREPTGAGTWPRRSPFFHATLEDIAGRVRAPTLFVGEMDDAAMDTLRELLADRAHFGSAASGVRRAGDLAELAWRRLDSEGGMQSDALEPIYVKDAAVRVDARPTRPA